MPYKIAGIDVHKRMLAVVVADIAGEGEYKFNISGPDFRAEDYSKLLSTLTVGQPRRAASSTWNPFGPGMLMSRSSRSNACSSSNFKASAPSAADRTA